MNNFIMFVGQVAAGKDYFLEHNQLDITAKYGVQCVLSSDDVIQDIAVARGLTYSEVFKASIGLATDYVENMIGILSLQQRDFILNQTNLTSNGRKRKLGKLIHPANYNKIAVLFDECSESEQAERLKERAEAEGKIIPAYVIESMKASFEYPVLEDGFDKIMTLAEFRDSIKKEEQIYGEAKFA